MAAVSSILALVSIWMYLLLNSLSAPRVAQVACALFIKALLVEGLVVLGQFIVLSYYFVHVHYSIVLFVCK